MIRFGQAIEKAHKFAAWHRAKLEHPDPERFYEDWKRFTAKLKANGEDWSEDEYSIMLTYSRAALHYDPRPTGCSLEMWTTGGLWAPQWGDLDLTKAKAAA